MEKKDEMKFDWELKRGDNQRENISPKIFKEESEGTFLPVNYAAMLEEWKKLYHAPFRFDNHGTTIFDAADNMVCQVRGWGRISSQKGEVIGAQIQDAFGYKLAELITNWYNNA
jgi:hypothetical protein